MHTTLCTMDVSEFKLLYEKEGKFNLRVQVPYLSQLGDHYAAIGSKDPTQNWTSVLKAHSLYSSCSARVGNSDLEFRQKAFQQHNAYCRAAGRPEIHHGKLQELQQHHQHYLADIREKHRKEVDKLLKLTESYKDGADDLNCPENHRIEETLFNEMRRVSSSCNADMIHLADKVMKAGVELLGEEPACDFAVVAFGSLSKDEATPYSDLEFLFLIKEKNLVTERYFEHLAMIVYFIIGNIQETNLKYMDIEELEGWFVDEGKSGFKIDGLRTNAGNIPTGNGKTDEKNKYICTAESLVEKYRALLQPSTSTNQSVVLYDTGTNSAGNFSGDDADMMRYLRVVSTFGKHGQSLFDSVQAAMRQIHPSENRKISAKITMINDIETYDTDPMQTYFTGFSMQVKPEIYRFPSLLVLNLKIMFNLKSTSTWESIDELCQEYATIRKQDRNLKCALALSMLIRLASYLHHGTQCEQMSLLKQGNMDETASARSDSGKRWHVSFKLYLIYCITIGPIKSMFCRASIWSQNWRLVSAIQAKIQSNDAEGALMYADKIPEFFYCFIPAGICLVLVIMNLSCERYEMAHKLLSSIRSVLSKLAKQAPDDLYKAVNIHTWETTLYLNKKDENQKYETILQQMIRSKSLSLPMAGYFLSAFEKARMNGYLSNVDLDEWGISLTSEMILDNVDTNQPMMLLGKGQIHVLNQQYKEAISCFEQYSTELEFLQGQGTTSNVLTLAALSIANSYSLMKLFNRSIDSYKKALRLDFLHHGKDNTFIRAVLYSQLGDDYFSIHKYDWAEKVYRTSLRIFIEIGNASGRSTCNLYRMLHLVYLCQNDPVTAELYKRKQLALERKLGVKVP